MPQHSSKNCHEGLPVESWISLNFGLDLGASTSSAGHVASFWQSLRPRLQPCLLGKEPPSMRHLSLVLKRILSCLAWWNNDRSGSQSTGTGTRQGRPQQRNIFLLIVLLGCLHHPHDLPPTEDTGKKQKSRTGALLLRFWALDTLINAEPSLDEAKYEGSNAGACSLELKAAAILPGTSRISLAPRTGVQQPEDGQWLCCIQATCSGCLATAPSNRLLALCEQHNPLAPCQNTAMPRNATFATAHACKAFQNVRCRAEPPQNRKDSGYIVTEAAASCCKLPSAHLQPALDQLHRRQHAGGCKTTATTCRFPDSPT